MASNLHPMLLKCLKRDIHKYMRSIKGFIAIVSITLAAAVFATAQIDLVGLDGGRVDVEGQNGKVVVLAMGASWLPLSSKQAEFTNTLAKKYSGKNVIVYFVMTDSLNPKSKNYATNDQIRKFATDNKISVTVLRDSEGVATLKKYHVEQVPSFVILNKTGGQAGEPFGGIDPKYDITVPISKAIDKLM